MGHDEIDLKKSCYFKGGGGGCKGGQDESKRLEKRFERKQNTMGIYNCFLRGGCSGREKKSGWDWAAHPLERQVRELLGRAGAVGRGSRLGTMFMPVVMTGAFLSVAGGPIRQGDA
jgi:hypothetical protein